MIYTHTHIDHYGGVKGVVDLRIDFAFTDLDQTWTVWVKRGVLNARQGASSGTELTVSGPTAYFLTCGASSP